MSGVTVSEVVKAFYSSLRTIDLRAVAVKPEKHWVNLVTSIFLSSKTREELSAEQDRLIENLPENTDKFGFFLGSYGVEHLQYLSGQIRQGRFTATRIPSKLQDMATIQYRDVDLVSLKVERHFQSYLKENGLWRLVGAKAEGNEESRRDLWEFVDSEQNGDARLRGFKDIYDMINETLGMNDFRRGNKTDFIVGIPVPARIIKASISNSSVNIQTKKAFNLTDLQLNLTVERWTRRGAYRTVSREMKLVSRSRVELKNLPDHEFCHVTDSIQVPDSKPHDSIKIKLIHQKIPALDLDETRLTVPLENAVEPFAKVLTSFCSLEDFRRQLLHPEEMKKGRMKADRIFENAVAWLLSLTGFSIAQLRDFEKLRVPETKYERGSIDMIAYRENECLLLVDCDTSIPESKKVRSMIALRDYFDFIQDELGYPRISSAIFSPRDCSEIIEDDQAVKIVDREQILRMLEDVMKGDQEQARQSLIY